MALFGLEENGLIESGFFTRDCDFPLLNLGRLFDDQFIKNIPTFFGRWRDNVTQRAITSVKPVLTIPETLGKCEFATIRTDVNGCRWIVPNMVSIRFAGEESMTWDEAIEDFCNARMIAQSGTDVRASLLGPNGLSFTNAPQIAGPFARFVLAGQAQGLKAHLQQVGMSGVQGNVMEFDGFLTQLRTGWTAADLYSTRCDDYNTAVVLNWAVLTGGAEGTPVGPDAVIDEAHDEITLWGQAISGFAGLNAAEFALRFMEFVRDEWASPYGGVDLWEWTVPQGQKRCLRELLACIQPCDGSGVLNDTELRERFAEYYTSDMVSIYPSDEPIMLQQSRQLGNTMILGPRMIGGDYTYGWSFRDMDSSIRQMDTWLRGHGYSNGQAATHPLVRSNLDNLRANFESVAFLWKLAEDDLGRCFTPTIETWPGMLVFARHMFLVLDDIICAPPSALPGTELNPVIGPESVLVDEEGCADGEPGEGMVTSLVLTLVADPATSPEVGDQVIVVGVDDVKVTMTVTDWDTPELTVESAVLATTCAALQPVAVIF